MDEALEEKKRKVFADAEKMIADVRSQPAPPLKCINCKHFVPKENRLQGECEHPFVLIHALQVRKADNADMVKLARNQRMFDMLPPFKTFCKEEGLLFEEKEDALPLLYLKTLEIGTEQINDLSAVFPVVSIMASLAIFLFGIVFFNF